jgi:hypothetical protein
MGYTKKCVVCGQVSWMLNAEDKCEECAKKDEYKEYDKSYVLKLDFVNANYTR